MRERNDSNTFSLKKLQNNIDKKINTVYNIQSKLSKEKKGDHKMAKVFSDKAASVLRYLQSNIGADVSAKDIAAAIGIETKSINGVITGLQRKGYVLREEVEGFEDKLVRLTSNGASADPDAEKE